jgi:alkanesulfonate monooxygenase SsuD/methylene tetrahydromethanopterin reductase-like flavin-dependent oxidoreductase (luciferase family)
VAGTDQAIAEQLVEIVRAGFTFLVPMLSDGDSRERFATAVIPLVRAPLA